MIGARESPFAIPTSRETFREDAICVDRTSDVLKSGVNIDGAVVTFKPKPEPNGRTTFQTKADKQRVNKEI
jgi:hypothetical protein